MPTDTPPRADAQDPLDDMVNLNFRVTERERRAFKAWCATNGMTQTDGFRAGFEALKAAVDDNGGA